MDRVEKNEMSYSSATKETTPLLTKEEPTDRHTKAIKPGKYDSVTEPSCGEGSAAAGTSRTCERDEASPSASGEAILEAEMAKKRRETEEEDLAEAINSYEGMADIVSPAFGCGLFYGIWLCLCYCLSSFMIQFPLHVLLLSLPISVGFMGARYMAQCPMNIKLPYAMMVVGGVGTLVLLVRLALLLHTKFSTDDRLKKWLKKGTKLLECLFFLSLILELYFSYEKTPSDVPLSPNYCNETFYSFVCSMNDVLITLVIVWAFLYFITGQRCIRRAAPP
ncbi:hypothetical protein AVEN_142904-1 [Araneus ventricosus]|uniref:Uncharacterized protein n=1 Tax=Araneus ventricosus TaxID=182803 RepID=A0A4Y2FLN3_ARAVE|nr:hypothetical protein AVEN_142904-1 [Araneus ventricosus]